MQKVFISKPEIKLVGLCVRTSFQNEQKKMEGSIFPCVQKYFHRKLYEEIPLRTKPGTTFCAYANYESDYKGAYDYFIGEEVASIEDDLPEGFQTLIIPAQYYVKFTTPPEPMPEVITNAWESIWKMSPAQLGGKRSYRIDFEIYDERAADHQNIVMDIYLGIDPKPTPLT